MELSQVQGLQGQHPGLRGLEGQHSGHRALVVVLHHRRNAQLAHLRRPNRHNLKKSINYAFYAFYANYAVYAIYANPCIIMYFMHFM